MTNNSKRWIILIVLVYLLIVSVVLLTVYPAVPVMLPAYEEFIAQNNQGVEVSDIALTDRLEIMFSHQDHFFDSDIEVSVFASKEDAVIYYTTDGSEPTVDSQKYTKPIHLEAAAYVNDGGVYPLKAIAVYGDTVTRPLVHTYFVAKDIDKRFNTMIFSLSTNDEYLYDYDTGIFVEGRTRDDYRRENPRVRIDPPAPANFNWRGFESERPVYVEIFEEDGRRVISQAAGVRVHGGWSRAALYKSMRIIPRNMYEPGEGRFRYDFFPEDVRPDGFGTPIARYDQLILSNNANDRDFGMLRQEVNYKLARQAGLRAVSPVRAAAMFVNGEYYGFAWLEVNINEQYLEDLYDAPTQDFQIVGNGEWWIESDDADAVEGIEYFNSFYNKDFTDDKVLEEFESIADIDNLLLYYAYQTYAGNRDWPGGNLKRWRYTGPWEEGLAPELDGRWRYVTYDLDFLMSLYEDNVNPGDPSFHDYMTPGNPRFSSMLAALFVRPELADRYAMLVCDIAANIITYRNVSLLITQLYGEAYKEIGYALATGKYSSWVSRNSIDFNHINMLKYTQQRADYFLEGIREYFGWDDTYFTVEVSGADAVIGTQAGTSSSYFSHLTVPVQPLLSKFEVFDHWVLNGEVINTPEITVSAADAHEGVVKIELATRQELPPLIIKEAYGNAQRNGAVLYNPGDTAINTEGLYFTDDLINPQLWAMPLAAIRPGETLEFAGRGSEDNTDLGKIRMGFNVRAGRVLYLCDESGQVLDWKQVPAD